MPLMTTVVGAYPKPDYLGAPDWFRLRAKKELGISCNSQEFTRYLKEKGGKYHILL